MLGGAKLTDIFLAEKNVVDFIDKNLGQEMDRLLEDDFETDYMCFHLVGGLLDFPIKISHDFCDITTCWDVYVLALTKETSDNILSKFGYGLKIPGQAPKIDKNPKLGKMPFRGDELTRKQFLNAVAACCPKIKNHIFACLKEVLESGRLSNLYVIISNVVIIRNYLWIFQEVFDPDSDSKIKSEYKTFCELVEIISEQMLQVQSNLLITFIFHDEVSQSWESYESGCYFEGERGSPTIQMWSYFLTSLQKDMWSIMPPQLSQRILAIILNDSLGILVSRYSKLKPSESNMPQFVTDIINILATVEKFLFALTSDMDLLCGQADPSTSKVIFSIHVKAHCLATSLVIIGCPLEILYKAIRHGIASCRLFESRSLDPTKFSKPIWMDILQTLCPSFYPSDISYSDWELLMHLKLLTAQPTYNWALVYKILTMNDCKIASLILSLFPSVVAPPSHFLIEGLGFKRCGHASCLSFGVDCHALPKSIANHTISSCTLYILAHGMPKDTLPFVYRSIFPRLSHADWSIMDRTQIWNNKGRPVWFQSLIDILNPVLKISVQALCLEILQTSWRSGSETPGPNSSSKLVLGEDDTSTSLVIELLNNLTDSISLIPIGFFTIAEEMDDLVPVSLSPLRNNVSVHFLVTSLYSLLSLGPGILAGFPIEEYYEQGSSGGDGGEGVKQGQVEAVLEPLLSAVAERAIHLDDQVFDQAVHRLITQIESMMKQTVVQDKKKKVLEETDFALEGDIASLKADFLMEEIEGSLALRVLYWFLQTHGDLLENLIAGDVNSFKLPVSGSGHYDQRRVQMIQFGDNTSEDIRVEYARLNPIVFERGPKMNMNLLKIAQRIRAYNKAANPFSDFHYINKYRTFDEIIWMKNDLDWVRTVKHCRMGLQKTFIAKQLERRWEVIQQQAETADPGASEGEGVAKRNRRNKIIDEIKALVN